MPMLYQRRKKYCLDTYGLENVLLKLSLKDSSIQDTIGTFSSENYYDISSDKRWMIVSENDINKTIHIFKIVLPDKRINKE